MATGDQLNVEITLQPLPSPQLTNQLTRTPSILVGHGVGPGGEVIRDLGTAPTLDLTEVEVTMFDHLVSSRYVRVVSNPLMSFIIALLIICTLPGRVDGRGQLVELGNYIVTRL